MMFVLPTAVSVAWLVRVRGTPVELIAKPLSSAGFILIALSEDALGSGYGRVVLAGLLLGALGDAALMFERWFLAGLGLFAAGHIAYIAAFAGRATPTLPAIAIAAGTAVAAGAWLLPRISEDMRAPVALYIVIISVMLATSLGDGQSAYVRAGGALFAFSDLLVARERFLTRDRRNALWGLPMYYTAQVLIALSVAP